MSILSDSGLARESNMFDTSTESPATIPFQREKPTQDAHSPTACRSTRTFHIIAALHSYQRHYG